MVPPEIETSSDKIRVTGAATIFLHEAWIVQMTSTPVHQVINERF